MMNGNTYATRQSADNDVWAILLEKAFAKYTGNYEMIQFGWQAEALKILTGAPTIIYKADKYWV